jgi:thioredoxin 1
MHITEVTDSSFDSEVLHSDLPVLVDFGAEWCHPCKQLDPIVEQLAEEWRGRVKVTKLDIDSNVQTTVQYGVMGVPTLILFVQGQPKERLSGFQPKARIIERLAPHLPGG